MSRVLRSLLVRLALAVCATAVLMGVLGIFGHYLHPWLPLAVALVIALVSWLLTPELAGADALETPLLDDEPEAVSPYAADVTVRRLEEMMHGAGPRRRMTGRSLGRMLALAAAERDHRDHADHSGQAPPLPEDLRAFLRACEDPDAGAVPAVTRPALQRWLRALSPQEDR
ncbi:hypothetical protein I8D64_15450 [Brachybacterium sp. MASK1Z-5]|uniref:DUF4175 domain-containing protein n=1 Tax=Brachybacterium halotolerans TaxID=2795215 RepID=A0ABS1BE02_9MICO|nr:hypothetical protein [Brachybacterium halotolerans]MBK0332797.1 hypothetical protein [Brachybacterium halotolerans]